MHTGSSHWPARVYAAPNISTVIGSAWLQLLLLKQVFTHSPYWHTSVTKAQPDFKFKGAIIFSQKIRDNFKVWLRYKCV